MAVLPERRAGLGANQEAARRHNLGTVLRHVHGAGRISRAELTTMMGLNRSTIADLTLAPTATQGIDF